MEMSTANPHNGVLVTREHPVVDFYDDDSDFRISWGPMEIFCSLDDLQRLQTEITAALMEAQRAEDGYRDMLNGEKEASEDYDGDAF